MTRKQFHFWPSPVFALGLALLVSCAQTPQVADTRPRFHEDAATDVVLQHYRWEHINLMRPAYREDGYLVQLSRESLGPALHRMQVKRDLAVVAFGWYFSAPEQLNELAAEWASLLRREGFQRVVFVRGAPGKSVDGLPIIADTRLVEVRSTQGAGF
ncbi:MAG TPA: hypothetical protein VI136_05245 [Verrucomicrobiae bacterium]